MLGHNYLMCFVDGYCVRLWKLFITFLITSLFFFLFVFMLDFYHLITLRTKIDSLAIKCSLLGKIRLIMLLLLLFFWFFYTLYFLPFLKKKRQRLSLAIIFFPFFSTLRQLLELFNRYHWDLERSFFNCYFVCGMYEHIFLVSFYPQNRNKF